MKEKLTLQYHNQFKIQSYIICSLRFSDVRTFNDKPLPTGNQVGVSTSAERREGPCVHRQGQYMQHKAI